MAFALTKKKLAEMMAKLDFCMMSTVGPYGHLESRPMSNNRNVEWDGDTWFFTFADSDQARQIEKNPNVNLAYQDTDSFLFIALSGKGSISSSVAKKKELWYKDLERWFPEGPEDEKVVLIKVEGMHATVWSQDVSG